MQWSKHLGWIKVNESTVILHSWFCTHCIRHLDAKSNESSDVKANGGPLQRIKGSVGKYEKPFESVGIEDWEAMQLEKPIPGTRTGDEHPPR